MSLKNWFQGKKEPPSSPSEPPSTISPTPGAEPPDEHGIPIRLSDITRGMQSAATAANQLIAHQYMQALDPFFEHTSDGRMTPKIIEMQIDDQHHLELPLVALSTPRGLMLEKMKVFLTVRTDAVEQQSIAGGEAEEAISRFQVSLSPPSGAKGGRDSGHVDIEMQFTVLEPPESVMRLIEEYTNRVLPKQNQEETEHD